MILRRLFLISFAVFALILFSFILIKKSYGSSSTMYLNPSSATFDKDKVITLQIKLNTNGEEINAISADLSYPESSLEITGITYGSSTFPIVAEDSYGGGKIKISRGSIDPVSGDVNVATLKVKAKKQGVVNISFEDGSAAPRYSDSSDSLNRKINGKYNFINRKGQKVLGVSVSENNFINQIYAMFDYINERFSRSLSAFFP